MSKISKITLVISILLLFISIFVQDDSVLSLLIFVSFFFLTSSKTIDELSRRKHLKEIKDNNIDYVVVKENSKLTIFLILLLSFNFFNATKTRYSMYKANTQNPSNNIMAFLSNLEFSEKILILTIVTFIILAIVSVTQALFSQTIISKDKVIFYDGIIFNISEIDDIEYDKWSISKNNQAVKLGKGLLDRKLVVKNEDFEKVKNMLEIKN